MHHLALIHIASSYTRRPPEIRPIDYKPRLLTLAALLAPEAVMVVGPPNAVVQFVFRSLARLLTHWGPD